MATSAIRRFFNLLASMGLTLRDDQPRVIDMTGRDWGKSVSGMALSIREARQEDPKQLPVLSVVIRNSGSERKTLTIPGWLFFYRFEITGPSGVSVPLTAYGRELLKPERRTEKIELALGPGDATETDLPVGLLFEMRVPGTYRMRVSCELPDGVLLRSNEIEFNK